MCYLTAAAVILIHSRYYVQVLVVQLRVDFEFECAASFERWNCLLGHTTVRKKFAEVVGSAKDLHWHCFEVDLRRMQASCLDLLLIALRVGLRCLIHNLKAAAALADSASLHDCLYF